MKLGPWWLKVILLFNIPFCQCLQVGQKSEEKCLPQEVGIPRYFYVDEHDLPFLIEVSNRITHQLVSHIFKILLTEVIGYRNVTFISSDAHREYIGENATRTLQKITNCENPKKCNNIGAKGPEVMLSLEVWLVPGFNMEGWTATGELEDCGPLGPVGRSGWFVTDYSVQELWQKNKTVLDHWRAFKNPKIAALFNFTNSDQLQQFTFDTSINSTYCQFDECDVDGIYRPERCQNITCAMLFVDYAEPTFDLLRNEINHLGLFVNVAWVGDNLERLVNDRIIRTLPTVFFHKKPSLLVSLKNFTHMSFPHCEDSSTSACEFQVYQLEKITWSKVKTNAQHAFHLLRAMSFTQKGYNELLDSYSRNILRGYSINAVACQWVQENGILWHKWIPGDPNEKTALYIGGIFPLSGIYSKHSGVITAAQMAVKAVNRNMDVLSNYHLALLEQDGHCVADEVMKSFINYITNGTYKTMIGILGPACTDTVEPIAGLAKHFNTIIISYSAEGSLFNNREKYPYFFRTIPENNQFRLVYLKLFQQLKWHRVAALTEDGQKYPEYISHLQDLFQSNGMTFIANRKFPRERTSRDMKPYLQDLKDKEARIIIGDFYDFAARAVMCAAYKLGMTGANGYQWFLPLWFSSDWFDTDHYNSIAEKPYEYVPCTTEQMIEAIDGHLSLTHKFYSDADQIMQEGITIGDWMIKYKDKASEENREVSEYGGYTYDAVWAFAIALHRLLQENNSHVATLHTPKTSRRFVELLNTTSFYGLSGYVETIASGRLSEVIICQWLKKKTHPVGIYRPFSHDEGELELNESHIVWRTANGLKPSDGSLRSSSCPLQDIEKLFNVSCTGATVIVNIFGVLVFIIICVSVALLFKRRYEKRMRLTENRMRELGLMQNSGLIAFDEFEMRRDYIVINRKVGEGAFGFVYGGEAFIQNKGWIPVAVKTLKVGAKTDEKLDFLSEAEVMKKFNHMNIVHLVGVCTREEPVYTVMELMLYGDLKSYLLGRRHLVNEPDRTVNDEVSDRRLTNMALDIARGLSYLADLKYVHRDLACRNCLVNANRCVKIADFGMCRPMYDHDYYRYNRKGMLPVRWMAPESLIDGLFTPMSDVWSYGVVLYEIITFGSFPYIGLSNTQVLEFVKNHNTLTVPSECSPELSELLKKCWSILPQDRPQAAEIVELLVTHPELISPSLDTPTASVEVEDTDSLEFTIHDRSRVHSVTSLWRSQRHFSSDAVSSGKAEYSQPASNPKDVSSSADTRLYAANKYAGRKSVPKDQKPGNSLTIIVTKL